VVRPLAVAAASLALAGLLSSCGRGSGAQLAGRPAGATTTSTAPDSTTAPPATTLPSRTTTPPTTGRGTTTSLTTPPNPPTTQRISSLANVDIRATRLAGFAEPDDIAVRAGDSALYIAEKRGRIRAYRNGAVDATPVLDISTVVSTGTEQGLLGMTFSPDGSHLYVNYSDLHGDTHIVEYAMAGGQADPTTRRELLLVPQPYSNNNGGGLAFGPGGKLWIGLGDGGSGGDPLDNAQSLTTLLGKILRIDPRPSGTLPYTIPSDNPFVNAPGDRPEIWAYGLRNPWRFSFDKATGDLWIGDVGQNAREEIDYLPAGAPGGQNYGWARLEGTKPYTGAAPANAVAPLVDYPHAGGACSIVGGFVYRGSRIPNLAGTYVYGDYCAAPIQGLRQSGGQVTDQRSFSAALKSLTSFGQDAAGELYVLSLTNGLFRIDPA
jgi:glucose/arabinose dehydrogenase